MIIPAMFTPKNQTLVFKFSTVFKIKLQWTIFNKVIFEKMSNFKSPHFCNDSSGELKIIALSPHPPLL